jgi:ubiquinone/menaquinone biosynthesis C-methylase UbiE
MPNNAIVSKLEKVSTQKSYNKTLFSTLMVKAIGVKSKFVYSKIKKHILGNKLLDVGTGLGGFATHLDNKNFELDSIDIANSSYFSKFPTQLYDGKNFPYKDKQFDTALLIHVLHHCDDRMQVLREALRSSKRVVFIEDTYRNWVEKLIVSLGDMLGNGEYYFHEYSKPEEWREILKKENCTILHEESYSRFTYHVYYGRYVLFVVEQN